MNLRISKHKWSRGFCIPWTTGLCRYWSNRREFWYSVFFFFLPHHAGHQNQGLVHARSVLYLWTTSSGTAQCLDKIIYLTRYPHEQLCLSPQRWAIPPIPLTCSVSWINPGQCQKPRISKFALAWTAMAFQSYCHVWDTWVILIILEANYINIHGEQEPL